MKMLVSGNEYLQLVIAYYGILNNNLSYRKAMHRKTSHVSTASSRPHKSIYSVKIIDKFLMHKIKRR